MLAREKKREREILKSAAEVFCVKGYTNASIQEIAHGAAIGKGTIYEYFSSKEQLYLSVMAWMHDEYIKKIDDVLRLEKGFLHKLNGFFTFNQEQIEKNYQRLQWMIKNDFAALSNQAKDAIELQMISFRKRVIQILENVLKEGEEEGHIQVEDKPFVADIFFEMVFRSCMFFMQNDLTGEQKNQKKDLIFQLFLKGISGKKEEVAE